MHAMFDVLQNGISPTEHLHKMIFVDGIMDFQSVKVIGFFCKAKALRPLALSLSSGIILCIPSIVKHGIHVCAKLMTRR